jgi:hypothetical protein
MIFIPLAQIPQAPTQLSYEVRGRYESRINPDFLANTADKRNEFLARTRIQLEYPATEKWVGKVQLQVAYNEGKTQLASFQGDRIDLVEASLKYDDKQIVASVGRLRFKIGNERLIGSGEWGNIPRSYDGIVIENKNTKYFVTRPSVVTTPKKAVIAGLETKSRIGPSLLCYKHDKVAGQATDHITFSQETSKKMGAFEFDAQGALQIGRLGNKNHRAWAWHSGVNYKPNSKTRLFIEFNAASGGSSQNESRTFDNLYPTNHRFYGNMDLQSWKNMTEIAAGVEQKFANNAQAKLSWRMFSLQNSKDAWYGASGAPNKRSGGLDFRDPTGQSGKQVGQEIDLEISGTITKNLTASAGVSLFLPGDFIKKVNAGASNRQTWSYLMVQFKP